MLEVGDLARGELPAFADPVEAVNRSLESGRPPRRITPTEYAETIYRIPDGEGSSDFTFDRVPYMRRPISLLDGRLYRRLVIVGPSQSTKSELALILAAWGEECDPADLLWLRGDRVAMQDFVIRRVNKMLRVIPSLRKRQLRTASADNIFSKEFLGGLWAFAWPTETHLESRPVRRTVADDSDRIKMLMDGKEVAESWRVQLDARTTRFEGEEFGLEISTPSLGFGRGIDAQFALGTREVYQIPCPACGEGFEPDLERDLRYDKTDHPGDARQSAHLVCPGCGGVMEPRQKKALVAAGNWVGPLQRLVAGGGGVAGPALESSTASLRVNFAVALRSWGAVAERKRTAELAFEQRQDESELRNVFNTIGGVNYRSRAGRDAVKAEDLAARETVHEIGLVPEWVQFLTAAVDVQGSYYAAMVMGWGYSFEACIVDRFEIMALEDGRTKLDPAEKPEHWRVLLAQVMLRRYALADRPDVSLPIACTAIDTGGKPGVTPNAYKFWHLARAAGIGREAIMLVKGGNNPKAKDLPPPTLVELRRGKANKYGPQIWVPNVNAMKDVIDVRLHRKNPGPGYIHFPRDFDPAYLKELTAETRNQDGIWERPMGQANETLDLAVYNNAACLRMVGHRSDLRGVPSSALRKTALKNAGTAAEARARLNDPAGAVFDAARPVPPPSSKPSGQGDLAARFRRLNGG